MIRIQCGRADTPGIMSYDYDLGMRRDLLEREDGDAEEIGGQM